MNMFHQQRRHLVNNITAQSRIISIIIIITVLLLLLLYKHWSGELEVPAVTGWAALLSVDGLLESVSFQTAFEGICSARY